MEKILIQIGRNATIYEGELKSVVNHFLRIEKIVAKKGDKTWLILLESMAFYVTHLELSHSVHNYPYANPIFKNLVGDQFSIVLKVKLAEIWTPALTSTSNNDIKIDSIN